MKFLLMDARVKPAHDKVEDNDCCCWNLACQPGLRSSESWWVRQGSNL
jgi:hypothetical protein